MTYERYFFHSDAARLRMLQKNNTSERGHVAKKQHGCCQKTTYCRRRGSGMGQCGPGQLPFVVRHYNGENPPLSLARRPRNWEPETNPRHAAGWGGGQAWERGTAVFAPTGRRNVAAGGAMPLSASRNPWERSCFDSPAPLGAEESPGTGVLRQPKESPSPRRGEKRKRRRWTLFPHPLSTGFASGP